ncbi:haloacid dehalogenase type II [Roseovarius nanhaiticus]|uniref:(S)-2-haloacid dehalogenase n=1 Tax=Roseovarius nanhaiticus TaxID=573024 RepID=A0A1N7G442_9RHOB|nr:haloacid dehalogenase type II [Roseovarius nanhaiticus]SEK37684.1 2-haloacid dehalogenase [Roseovarius nanhaiticus]SIS07373.1 2-haloacid dehalogenase [Roseovarius nanhaiticus]
MAITTCIFDAYGTLLDVAAAARTAAEEPGQAQLAECWPDIAQNWRLKQLQYTWLRTIMEDHADFWTVTGDALDWALAAEGIEDAALRARLMELYRELGAYPEVAPMLRKLKEAGLNTAILSNGTPEMLEAATVSAGIRGDLDDILSVEMCGIYKPAKVVYDMVGRRFACAPEKVLFVSSNGWDAAAASAYGFTVAWANRADEPVECLPGKPAHVLRDLSGIPALAGI